ncbi:hypothetical protein [Agaribacter flavus]|uniref:Phosphate ABC transporter substrate-binding protein n=1 Tax=Agaribacter flavus TaxID=1902781 RepID=A0ABV7FR57_9ALTE
MKNLLSIFILLFSFTALANEDEKLVIVASADSQINSISRYELIGIYMGRYRSGRDMPTLSPVDNEAYEASFYREIINKSMSQVNSYWARLKFTGRDYQKPRKSVSSDDAIAHVLSLDGAITYIPKKYVDERVKIVYEIE